MRPTLPGLLALCLASSATAAEGPPIRVVTLDGRTLRGTEAKALGTRIEIRTGPSTETVDLADVLEASLEGAPPAPAAPAGVPGGPAVEVEFVNRDVLRGALVRGLGEAGFVVRSAGLGEVEVGLDAVAAVRFPAAYAGTEDPPALQPGEKEDRFLFLSGDRLDGTLRSVDPAEVRVRPASGGDRALRVDSLLGFALVPLPGKPERGLRVQLVLRDGSRLSGSEVLSVDGNWLLRGMVDGKDRPVPTAAVEGLAVRGGRGVPLSDLEPASVEVKPYWGDDPPVLQLRPRMDRAFTLDRGSPPPLRLGGRTWFRGVSAFSGTTLTWNLEGRGWRRFLGAVGVDDAGPRGAVEFEVLVDGKSAWRSGVVRTVPPGGEPTAIPAVDVSGARTLSLVVHAGPDDDVQDFADWVRAALLP